MNLTRLSASVPFAVAALTLSLAASAQTAQPQPQPVPVTPPAAQAQPAPHPPAPPVYAAPAHPPATVAPVPVYRTLPQVQSAAPMQPYPAYDPSTGQMVLVAPMVSAPRMPPKELPYVEGRSVPPGYAIDEYHPRGLIIGGAITLGALWAISFSVASSNDFSGANGWLAVPVIGPFGWLATRKAPQCEQTSYSYNHCNSDESSNRTLVALDGLGQLAGAAMLVTGLAITRKRLVLVDPQAAFSVAPYASSRGSGLQLIGRF